MNKKNTLYPIITLIRQIYVGNIDKTIKSEELRTFFHKQFPSVSNAKIIVDPISQKSKGFGFVDFTSYQEYQKVLENKVQKIFRNNKLIIK